MSTPKTRKSVNVTADTPKIPGVEFVGRGYNLVAFDPLDPGNPNGISQIPVFELGEIDQPTQNGDYLIPRGMTFTSESTLDYEGKAAQYQSAADFSGRFNAEIMASVGYSFVNFSASGSYKSTAQMTQETSSIVSAAVSSAKVWNLSMPRQGLPLSSQFKKAVGSLPVTYNEQLYFQFFQTYGTHTAKILTFGGRAYQTYQYTQESGSQLTAEGVNVSVAASVGLGLSVKVGGFSERDMEEFRQLSEVSESSSAIYVGGTDLSSYEAWARTVRDSPLPVGLSLGPIVDLVSAANFPELDVAALQANLNRASEAYAISQGSGYVKYVEAPTDTEFVYNLVGVFPTEQFLVVAMGSAFGYLIGARLVGRRDPQWHVVGSASQAGGIVRTGDTLRVEHTPQRGTLNTLAANGDAGFPTPAVRIGDAVSWRIVDPVDVSNTGQPVLIGVPYALENVTFGKSLGFYGHSFNNFPFGDGTYVPVADPASDQRTHFRFI